MVSALVWGTRGRRFKSGRPDQMDRILTVPNLLSFLRLATVPVFVYLFVTDRRDAAVLLYGIAASTDFFDGYIARRTNSVTELGTLLDPLADRIFIAALAIALVITEVLSPWLAAAVVGRDVVVLALYPFVQSAAVKRIRVNRVGKTATAALLFGLTSLAVGETSVSWASVAELPGFLAVVAGAVLYWVAGAMYAREAIRLHRAPVEVEVEGGTGGR